MQSKQNLSSIISVALSWKGTNHHSLIFRRGKDNFGFLKCGFAFLVRTNYKRTKLNNNPIHLKNIFYKCKNPKKNIIIDIYLAIMHSESRLECTYTNSLTFLAC